MPDSPKLTVRDIRRMHRDGAPITVLTAYDAMFGRLADESGVDIVLVGDTLGMMVLGYPTTLQVTLDESLHHTRAVARGVQRPFSRHVRSSFSARDKIWAKDTRWRLRRNVSSLLVRSETHSSL